jgi:hypothetical protein
MIGHLAQEIAHMHMVKVDAKNAVFRHRLPDPECGLNALGGPAD